MTDSAEQSVPVKCKECSRPMSTPLVCDYCHALNASAAMTDHFTLLGLEPRFDLDADELHRRYLALSRQTHPDFHASDSAEAQSLHLRVSAALNDAYHTLKDPARRATCLLELLGGKSSAEDKSVPDGFLGTMMMMQEEIADARADGNGPTGQAGADELARVAKVLRTQHDGLIRRIAGLFQEYQKGVACAAVRTGLLGEIRCQLNAVSYVKKLLSQACGEPGA